MKKRGRPRIGQNTQRMSITFESESLKSLKKAKSIIGSSENAKAVRSALECFVKHHQDKDMLIGDEELKFFQSYIRLVGPTTLFDLLDKLQKTKVKAS